MNKIFFLVVLSILHFDGFTVKGQIHTPSGKLVLMAPGGTEKDGLPVMRIYPDSSNLSQGIRGMVDSSVVGEIIDLYFLAQTYALNGALADSLEPAYLAITSNQGGYAKKGFYLESGNVLLDKSTVPYIDIREDAATAPAARLMSFTQLYPHELGHVLYHLLSNKDTASSNHRNVDMHYFSLVTDFPTAFNEGFAEHMENIARIYESNQEIKAGIQEDMEAIGALVDSSRPRFRRDLKNPLRLGYYKASMVNWFQKYEDYKRYSHALSGVVRYKNTTPGFRNIEDRLTYRNTGLEWDTSAIRNVVQLHSTEGVISSFFTRLSTSSLAFQYQDSSFYAPFTSVSGDSGVSIRDSITPLQNIFMKYFHVFRNYVDENNSDRSQLIDFMEGYMQRFPEEEAALKDIYKEVTGIPYSDQVPPPLWILLEDKAHRMLTLDAYGGITLPIYTFDLNAAELEDLLSIDGISITDAEAILEFRNAHGLYQSLDDLRSVPGLQAGKAELIISNSFETSTFEDVLGDFESKLTLSALIVKPLLSILIKLSSFFLLSYILFYLLFQRKKKKTISSRIFHILRHYMFWILASFLGLILVVMVSNALLAFIVFGVASLLLAMLRYRKHKDALIFTSSMFLIVVLLVLFSMI